MNPTELEELLHLTADSHDVGAPTLGRLIEQGSARRRRRRLASVGVAGLATVLAISAAFALWPADDHARRSATGPTSSAPSGDEPPLDAPAGTRLVGLDGVAVAVPANWATQDTRCGSAQSDTIVFDEGSRDCLALPPRPVSELHLSTVDSVFVPDWAHGGDETSVDGVQAYVAHRPVYRCPYSGPGYDSRCEGVGAALIVPSRQVVLWVLSPDQRTVDEVLGSARLIPGGFTAVPYVPLPDHTHAGEQLLADAGLDATVVDTPAAMSLSPPWVTMSPSSGSVVRDGTVVQLSWIDPVQEIVGDWVPALVDGDDATDEERTDGGLSIDPDGHWAASDTCNDHWGPYAARGDALITFTPRGQTLVGCDPRLAVIVDATGLHLVNGRLVLTNDAGRELVVYTRAATQ